MFDQSWYVKIVQKSGEWSDSAVVLYKWVGGNAAGWWVGLVRDGCQIKRVRSYASWVARAAKSAATKRVKTQMLVSSPGGPS